jgi:divalent metal cation (Fe/Co/Zn/Cd) transporter
MAREQGGEPAPAPAAAEGAARGSRDQFTSVPLLRGAADTSESLTTVLVALGANVLIAVAKSAAAVVTGSASLVAEAAHSWADSGNEIFLLIANRRARRPPDPAHPLGAHQLTGSPTPDAIGSILVGLLLGVVAIVLINRNRRFLVGEEADPRVRSAAIRALLEMPEVARVTYLRLEVVGPRMVFVTGDVDLTGDDTESHVAVRLRALEAKFCASPAVAGAVLSLSAPDEPGLQA